MTAICLKVNRLRNSRQTTPSKKFFKTLLNSFIDFDNEEAFSLNSSLLPRFDLSNFELGDFLEEELKNHQNIVISTQYPSRISDVLNDFEIPFSYEKSFDKKLINIIKADIYEGFVSDDLNLTLITHATLSIPKKLKHII